MNDMAELLRFLVLVWKMSGMENARHGKCRCDLGRLWYNKYNNALTGQENDRKGSTDEKEERDVIGDT